MRTWYNGYRFTDEAEDLVYNPTNVLYFLESLAEFGKPPQALHDPNLRTDQGKFAFLARTAVGSGVIEQLTEGDGTVKVAELVKSFSLKDLTHVEEDRGAVASFLYYMGLLTRTRDAQLRELDPVRAALAEARRQVLRYRDALVAKLGEVRPRCYAVVAVGLERMLGEEVVPG